MSIGVRAPFYRLPDAAHPGGVQLLVSDLARSVEYYERVIGLFVLSRDDVSADLAPRDSDQPLLSLRSRPDVVPTGRSSRLGLYHFALLVPDRAALGRFLAHLSAERVAVSSADHAVSEALYLWDPDGLGIEVYRDRLRNDWRMKGRELFMTSERLDLRSLLQAADGDWDGLRSGTVLGHMHLHVGDLAQAESFYHRGLGLDKIVWSYPGALFLSAGGYHHHLGANTWAGHAVARAENEAGLLSWELVLPSAADVEQAMNSCVSVGASATKSAGGWALTDPWGTVVVLRAEARG